MKALIGMSGGVDSSVAALLTKNMGYDCLGATMKLEGALNDDTADAAKIAEKLGIPYLVVDLSEDFKTFVLDPFCAEYIEGKTPNPCIECNKYLKFGKMIEKAKELGAEYVVTGHYARIERDNNGKFILKKAKDLSKDQSYMLYNMTQQTLAHTLLPLGEYTKEEIRKIAEENGFLNARKKDSQDICFVPNGDYAAFIEKHSGFVPEDGHYVNLSGEKIGCHKGVINYTVGQRKGFGVAFGKPMFVVSKNAEENTVTLSDEADLFCDTLYSEKFNFISGEKPSEPIRVTAKTRYSQTLAPATVYPEEEGKIKIVFDDKQRAISSGQSVVIYDGDILLGGGKII